MAVKEEEKDQYLPAAPSSHFTIDSKRIKQAADPDTSHELRELGISVYDQDDFEMGVMRQLDEEAARQNVEQQRKFLSKELDGIKRDIR